MSTNSTPFRIFLAVLFFTLALLTFASVLKLRLGVDAQVRQCLPFTLYINHLTPPDQIKRGQLLGFVAHGEVGHGFDGKLMTKMVAAIPGDTITIKQDQLYVNGIKVDRPMDLIVKLHKKPGAFDRTEIVPPGHVFFIGTEPHSFDSRYWGFITFPEIVAQATPVPGFGPDQEKFVHETLGPLL
ncbi:MAG: signal peptidase I [Ferrovum myxofaciens]|nr:signal peptidase I [Ferrovum myxofaciens]QKE37370.1 MAG: signal peptidase I [Ferrovum myxofaciens]